MQDNQQDVAAEAEEELLQQSMQTHREAYDWSEHEIGSVPPYYEQQNEMTKVLADVAQRYDTNKLPRYLIGGPTGCGKTQFAKAVAAELDAPFFEIQCKYSMNELDLLGSPRMVGGHSYWSDGPLTKALMASATPEQTKDFEWSGHDGPVVLLLDEVNRARPEAKGVLLSALDKRAEVAIEPRGGEVISGNAQDLIVFATINEGPGYMVERMDKAEVRRFNTRFDLSYLGETRPDSEIRLLTERTPIASGVAMEMVGVANTIRNMAADDDSEVRHGIPTSMLLSWARTAAAYADNGLTDPVMEAARDTVVSPFYNDNQTAANEVENIIGNELHNAPVDETREYYEWLAQDSSVSTPFNSIDDVPKNLDPRKLNDAGMPKNVTEQLKENEQIHVQTLQSAGLSDKTVMLLAKNA